MGRFLKNRLVRTAGYGAVMPYGTTALRPTNPIDGDFRFNKDMFSKLDISDETKNELIFNINNYKKERNGLGYYYNYKLIFVELH